MARMMAALLAALYVSSATAFAPSPMLLRHAARHASSRPALRCTHVLRDQLPGAPSVLRRSDDLPFARCSPFRQTSGASVGSRSLIRTSPGLLRCAASALTVSAEAAKKATLVYAILIGGGGK